MPCGRNQHGPITTWLAGLFVRVPPQNTRPHLLNQVRPVCNDVLEEQPAPAALGCLGAWLMVNGGIQ